MHKDRYGGQWNRPKSPGKKHACMAQWSLTSMPKIYNGEKIVFTTNGAGKLDVHMLKDETRFFSLHKNQLKMD